jgi:glycine/D-amino acid oxidase-like deaminating enzyme
MNIEFLIIGQGISGTWLSYYLKKEGRSFIVIDDNNKNSSSRLAAGVINPVTGRRHVEVWMANEILPFAQNAYEQIGSELNILAISSTSIIDFFPTAQMRLSFLERVEEKNDYVFLHENEGPDFQQFRFDFGAGVIRPVFIAHLESILPAWRQELSKNNLLLEEHFNFQELKMEPAKILYRDIVADVIIFCDGQESASNDYFRQLPFAPNKGEMLIVEIPGLPKNHIYKKGMVMVPMLAKDHWWVGSDYQWEFENELPTPAFRDRIELLLKAWLKIPFTIVDHLAGIRPATIERRPFVGIHPLHPNIGILNGMGTKGCSLAPYFAKQLVDQLCFKKPILAEADVSRFKKILSR